MMSIYESTWTVDWFGTATFRVRHGGLNLFFDGYLDRLPGLDPVGLRVADVDRADFVFISHAHFDHLYGVAPIARSTGATVVASPESARILRQDGIPDEQLLMVTGGETVRCGPGVSVRVLPALHSCLFAARGDSAVECHGDLGVSAQDRRLKVQGIFAGGFPSTADPVAGAMKNMLDHSSIHDGASWPTCSRPVTARPCSAAALATGPASSRTCVPMSPSRPWPVDPTCRASPTRGPRPVSCWSRRRPWARGGCASATTTPCCPGSREPTSPRRQPC